MKQPTYTSAITVPPVKTLDKNKVLPVTGIPAAAGGKESDVETPSKTCRGGNAAVRGLRFSDNDSD
jgi:hypothetical protein